jgi:hypothetical protein
MLEALVCCRTPIKARDENSKVRAFVLSRLLVGLAIQLQSVRAGERDQLVDTEAVAWSFWMFPAELHFQRVQQMRVEVLPKINVSR